MQPADTEQRLEEWSRWSRAYGHHRRRCESAEGAYRSPQHWEPITHARPPSINVSRCLEVELVVVQIGDPWRLVIVSFYIHQVTDFCLRRKLKRWRLEPAIALAEAQQRVGERLARDRYVGRMAGSPRRATARPALIYAVGRHGLNDIPPSIRRTSGSPTISHSR